MYSLLVLISALLLKGGLLSAETLPGFPSGIPLSKTQFKNWAIDLIQDDMWTATPENASDVVSIANWAAQSGFRVRASGEMHTWSKLTITDDSASNGNILLVKTEKLKGMKMTSTNPVKASVSVGAGELMNDFLQFLEDNGFGFLATPAPGDITVAGALAIDAHGTGVPSLGETLTPGHTYGSLSNMILSFTAVTWNATTSSYGLQTFHRTDPDAAAFLTNLGRTFLTKVEMRVGVNHNLRCVSRTDITAAQLFGDGPTNTLSSFLDSAGRVEAILFPFTDNPWLKVWTVVGGSKPLVGGLGLGLTTSIPGLGSRWVTSPYNYPFSDNVPEVITSLVAEITTGNWALAPTLGAAQLEVVKTGLLATLSSDITGPSKNLLLYVKPTTLRVTANGYAVITKRENAQWVVKTFFDFYEITLNQWRDEGKYPINGPLEVRVTGLDRAEDVLVENAVTPMLSAVRPFENTEFDTAIWFDILTFPETELVSEFMKIVENFILTTFNDGVKSKVRMEWSKGWGYTGEKAWDNATFIQEFIPSVFPEWSQASSTLAKYDPENIFSNEFLDKLFLAK